MDQPNQTKGQFWPVRYKREWRKIFLPFDSGSSWFDLSGLKELDLSSLSDKNVKGLLRSHDIQLWRYTGKFPKPKKMGKERHQQELGVMKYPPLTEEECYKIIDELKNPINLLLDCSSLLIKK